MGMMINNSIEALTSILKEATEWEGVCYVTSEDAGALKMAIDTMRKYQKIQELMKADDMVENIYFGIEEVIEDGND